MCGICFGVGPAVLTVDVEPTLLATDEGVQSSREHDVPLGERGVWTALVEAVKPRGPDYSASLFRLEHDNDAFAYDLCFHTSVLHMRGVCITPQPFVAPNGDVFLFNGEIFGGLEITPTENDGQVMFDRILEVGLLPALEGLEGPYSIIYYEASTHRIYYSRDPLGRRSLLVHLPTPSMPYFLLGSTTPGAGYSVDEWTEVDCSVIHCCHLGAHEGEAISFELERYTRASKGSNISPKTIYPLCPIIPSATQPPTRSDLPHLPLVTPELQLALDALYQQLSSAVKTRVNPLPHLPLKPHARVAVLFSGGIDCATLALLADAELDQGEAIDLINVAFENPRVLGASRQGMGKRDKGKARQQETLDDEALVNEMSTEVPKKDANSRADTYASSNDALPSFLPVPDDKPDLATYEVPDRLTGRGTLEELRRLRPVRRWNFVEVNVPYPEMIQHRQTVIDLMSPNHTVMDLSIAIAFYFASRGKGIVRQSLGGPTLPYQSHARVLLSGLGADELMGGYARHRRAFTRTGPEDWASLISELQLDVDRLPTRNLGRDDRIVSVHGKEVRYPFLAEGVVEFCTRTLISLKCDMRFMAGVGDKMLLRLLARSLGLSGAAELKKRAIHFGARTAKMDLGSGRDRGDALLD